MGQPQNGRHAGPQGANFSPPAIRLRWPVTTSSTPVAACPRGNEKPDAEGTVKAVQRRFATPVPRVADRDELNLFFRKCCEAERERTVQRSSVRS